MPAKKCGEVGKDTCYKKDTCVWIRLEHDGKKGYCKDLTEDYPECLRQIEALEASISDYGDVKAIVEHYYSSEVWETLANKSSTPSSNAHRRQLFLAWDMLYALHALLEEQKETDEEEEDDDDDDSPYVAYTLPFRDFYQSKFTYVDKGYVPGYATHDGVSTKVVDPVVPENARVCWINRPVAYKQTCQKVTYNPQQHDPKDVFFSPKYKNVPHNYTGPEAFTTPTPYMSYLTVYKYPTHTDQMAKVPKVLETIMELDGRDDEAGRERQRHCVFTQTNMILNMLPYFVAHGYFIPNRLPRSEKDRNTFQWFLLAKNAKVTKIDNQKVSIQWPKTAANGYYVPQGVTTVEPMDHFEFRKNRKVVTLEEKTPMKVNLFVAPKKRIVYLYKEPPKQLDVISGNKLETNKSFKLKMMRDFFNASVDNAHIIIIDEAFKEGLSLLNVAYMHLCEVVSTIGDFQQATARIARKCKSLELPVVRLGEKKELNLRFVSIFTYESLFPLQTITTGEKGYTYNKTSNIIYKNGKLLCKGTNETRDALFKNYDIDIPSEESLDLIAQIFTQLGVSEEDEKRIRSTLTLSFDHFYRQLIDIDNVAGISSLLNEWMKAYSFDISQKDNLEKFQLAELVSKDDFKLANEKYKELYVPTPSIDASEAEELVFPTYEDLSYTGDIEYTDMGLGTFIFKRMKEMNNMQLLSFPGGNLLRRLRWTAPLYDEGAVIRRGKLENIQVLQEAFASLTSTARFVMVHVELVGSESHANVLVFFKQQQAGTANLVVVERYDPNGFEDMYYAPEKLNLALQDALQKEKPDDVTIKYVTPIDQCAFNMNYELPGSDGNCVPFSVFYMDLRLMNPNADSVQILQTLRKKWGKSVVRTLTLDGAVTGRKKTAVTRGNSNLGFFMEDASNSTTIKVQVKQGAFRRNNQVQIQGRTFTLQRVVGPREIKVKFMENFKNHALSFMEEIRRMVPEAKAMNTTSGIAEAFGRLSPERKEAILNKIVDTQQQE
jgi:hypothetical protein